jgi:hypothetical protein
MPRFVILEHDWPTLHWDLLLEAGDVLWAWRLLEEPATGKDVPAERNFDHRKLYLDFEGPLSGDRGSVKQWESGTFEWFENASDRVVVKLEGTRLKGTAELNATWMKWFKDAD